MQTRPLPYTPLSSVLLLGAVVAATLLAPGELRGSAPGAPLPCDLDEVHPEPFSTGAALAQAEPGPPGGVRERVAERIRLMRAWRLTEVLELDEATAVSLFERLDAYDAANAPLRAELERAGRELRRALDSEDTEETRIAELTARIVETHLSIEQLRAELVRDSSDILTPRQVATFMLFLPEFEREVREMIRDVRRQHRRDRGARDGSGRGGRERGARGRRGDRGQRGNPAVDDGVPREHGPMDDDRLGPPPGLGGPPVGPPPGPGF